LVTLWPRTVLAKLQMSKFGIILLVNILVYNLKVSLGDKSRAVPVTLRHRVHYGAWPCLTPWFLVFSP
jgi:hypothetical protein